MGFLDGLGATISQKSNEVAAKTRDMVEITNINGQIAKLNKTLQQQYQILGEHYYQEKREVEEDSFKEEINAIGETLSTIAQLNDSIEKLRAANNTAASMVSRTSTAMQNTNLIVCQKCGAQIAADSMFCTACGAKVEQQESEN